MMPRTLASILLLLLASLHPAAQNPHPAWRNFTTNDGLVANEVHYCMETPDGYMWFATDNGLSRFDGYGFKNYGVREGLGDPVIFYLQLDPQGRLWMATLSSELFYLEGDRIHAFEHNDIIKSLKDSIGFDMTVDFYIDEKDHKFLGLRGVGILEFTPEGGQVLHQPLHPHSDRMALKHRNRWLATGIRIQDSIRSLREKKYMSKGNLPPVQIIADSTYEIWGLKYQKVSSSFFVKELKDGRVVIYYRKRLYELMGGKILWGKNVPYLPSYKSIYEMEDGHIYVGMQHSYGLRRYQNLDAWKNEDYDQYLPGKSISNVFEDSEGSLWAATVEDGIFYCPNLRWMIYDQTAGLSMNNVTSLAIKNENGLYLGLRNGQVYYLDRNERSLLPIPMPSESTVIDDLIYYLPNDELWVGKSGSRGGHSYRKNGTWATVRVINKLGNEDWVIAKNLSLRKGGHRIWGGGSSSFGGIDLLDKRVVLNSRDLGMLKRTMAVWESADSTLWIGNGDGLFILKDSVLTHPTPFHPAYEIRVDDLTEMSDGTLVVATKGAGILLVKENRFRQITAASGLTADLIENVYADDRDNIWAGTPIGLNKISGFHWSGDTTIAVRQLTAQHGLPSNEIKKVEVWEDEVWVATSKGLVHFKDDLVVDSFSRPPTIISVLADMRSVNLSSPPKLSFWENNVTIQFLTINYRMNGRIPYRFRVDGGAWTETMNRSVNFPSLPPGERLFEVQSQNQDGIWSKSAGFGFHIAPPWWETWWVISLGVLAMSAFVFGVYKYRTHQLKTELELQKQLSKVERQALRSQMNPHFIFNSLNAIQGFIALGDKAAANRYLSRFAKLIRSALQHSRVTKVPLADDLNSLKNYLELEQLRFEGRFGFTINIADDIDVAETNIPPMLVQPFVENAIVHGLAKKEGKGQIGLDYRLENNHLVVTITDNGIGIEASKKQKEGMAASHKSIGLTVTARRLEMLGGKGEVGRMETTELKDGEGKVAGTQVRIWVPVM